MCDSEVADDCAYMAELGARRGWREEQFHALVVAAVDAGGVGWHYDPRRRWYLCPPCQAVEEPQRRASALARQAFAAPFVAVPTPESDRQQ